MRRFGWLVLAGAAIACGSGSGGGSSGPATIDGVQVMAGFDPGPAPAAGTGFQAVLPIVNNIAAGGSYEYCTWTNVILPEDVWIKSAEGIQTETGHHIVIFYTTNTQPAGTSRICNDSDMATFRFAMPASGGGEGATTTTLPGDLATKLPKGAQIVLNHHYLNASTHDVVQAQSAINVHYATPGAKITPSNSMVVLDDTMQVPVGKSSLKISCTLDNDYATWAQFPHAHQYATHFTVDHTPAGGATNRMVDVDWTPDYAFHPPEKSYDPSSPYVFHKGDQLNIQCDYNNPTGKPLDFGMEMCIFFTDTVDPNMVGNMACDKGTWGPY